MYSYMVNICFSYSHYRNKPLFLLDMSEERKSKDIHHYQYLRLFALLAAVDIHWDGVGRKRLREGNQQMY